MSAEFELRWVSRTYDIGGMTDGTRLGRRENVLQVRRREGPRDEGWWGEWTDVPFCEEE